MRAPRGDLFEMVANSGTNRGTNRSANDVSVRNGVIRDVHLRFRLGEISLATAKRRLVTAVAVDHDDVKTLREWSEHALALRSGEHGVLVRRRNFVSLDHLRTKSQLAEVRIPHRHRR